MNNMQSKVVNGLVWRFAERICAQGVSLVVSIILARLLMPSDYGAISMVLVFIAIANVFVDAGFCNALVQKKECDSVDFSTAFYFNMAFSILLYFLLFGASPMIADFYGMPVLSPVMRIFALQIIIAGVKSTQVAYVQRNMLFRKFFWSTLGGTFFSGIVGIVMAYHGFGVWSIVAQYLLNSSIDTTVLWFTVKWRPTLEFSFKRWKSLFNYGWKLLIWSLSSTLYDNLRNLIIGKKYSSSDLAFYTKGKQWPNLLISNINTSISSVLFPALSQYQDNLPKLKSMTRKAMSLSSYILGPMLLGMAALSTPIISLLLTDKWLEAVPYMIICCFYLVLMPMQTANLEAIKAMGRSDIILKLEVIKKIVQITLLIVSMHFGVMAIAASAIITTLFACIVNAWPNRKLLQYGYGEQMKDMLPNLTISAIMSVVVFFLAKYMSGKLSQIIIIVCGIICGIIIYWILSIITRNVAYQYLFNYLKRKIKDR
ncbi:lipopolysaccharide biosynthesis protein [Hungatella hathewayi]|uniref:lipopolysaccharide biosynthesis protein n=1 Tax=Hungatella hathewayi TaxID=154046 RepID=UPI0021087540|nr:lipopolysaccharide biosynthesis protein [Hungatella hathewayi]MCQ5386533.1 lipopolysaccharide biosynthesis protein [Hungatella hathewayi]